MVLLVIHYNMHDQGNFIQAEVSGDPDNQMPGGGVREKYRE